MELRKASVWKVQTRPMNSNVRRTWETMSAYDNDEEAKAFLRWVREHFFNLHSRIVVEQQYRMPYDRNKKNAIIRIGGEGAIGPEPERAG